MRTGKGTKRALFIVITDYPGGAERVTFGLASELAARPGWQVEVLIVCRQLPDSFTMRALPPDVKVRYGLWHSWYLSFPLLPFRLIFRPYDLVFTTHVYANALVSMLRRLRLTQIGRLVMRESTSIFDRYSGLKRRFFAFLYRCYGAEDLLIAQTNYMGDHVRPRLPASSAARLEVLPNPIAVAAIERSISDPLEDDLCERLARHVNILFCGRMIEVKRPKLALEVFRRLGSDEERCQLVFMGAGPLEAAVREEASRIGLADRVLFLGQRGNPYAVMAACEYGLLTSANEGFPNVVLEMMGCGMKKVVVTPCAGDLDKLTGVTVTRTHIAEELADALREAIRTGEDCSEIYRAVAASRSASAYVDRLIGTRTA